MSNLTALLIIDVQNDFCPGGMLPVSGGDAVVPVINGIQTMFHKVAATQDWHPKNHVSFASNHKGKKPFESDDMNGISQTLWPDHCVQGTKGAAFHPGLAVERIDLIVRKGTNPLIDSYSAFMENDRKTITGLEGYLNSLGITGVYLCGLATDFCVYFTAMDAASLGFETHVIIDACRGIDVPENNIENALSAMKERGIKITTSREL